MQVVRTLEYIYNEDLNKYLSSKFRYAKDMGIEVEIELTELIENLFIDFEDYKKILDRAFRNAFRIIKKVNIKKLSFAMFYNYGHLYFIIEYPSYNKYGRMFYPWDVIKNMDIVLKDYDNVHQHITHKKLLIVHQIAVVGSDKEVVFY